MKIAIIGAGISGLTCAYLLNKEHDVTVFESADRIGGHTATVDINYQGQDYAIDTGFIVYNDWTYPNFIRLLKELGVETQKTQMSFSVNSATSDFEYSGSSLNTLFSQRKNAFKPSFIKMVWQITRFNKQAIADLNSGKLDDGITLREYLTINNYSASFAKNYLIPMGSAIWSSSCKDIYDFPAIFFLRFFKNHGLLSIKNRPQWHVIKGGSKQYLKPLVSDLKNDILTGANIQSVQRKTDGVHITQDLRGKHHTQQFDHVIFACHSDQALKLIKDPSQDEQEVLTSIAYQDNDVTLHTDTSLLPKNKRAWASWNYQLDTDDDMPPVLSYNMNILQSLNSEHTFVVSLNAKEKIAPDKVIQQFNYAHPVFTLEATNAQQRWSEINGVNNTSFCGAYWRNGFHEDGCYSGIRVAKALGSQYDNNEYQNKECLST